MTSAELKYLTAIKSLCTGSEGISLTDISVKVGVSKVSVYRAVEHLEKGGYVERDEKNKVVITPYGIGCLEEYTTIVMWLGEHFEKHCNVSKCVAYEDAVGAVCAISDQCRRGIFEHMNKAMAQSHDDKGET